MPEPRRWSLVVCEECGEWEWVDRRGFCECGGQGRELEVIEAAPVEAELERLRKIEAAARHLVETLEDEDGVRGKSCLCGDAHCVAANRLREALEASSDA